MGPTQTSSSMGNGVSSLAAKRPEREADYSHLLNAKVICYLARTDTISCIHSCLDVKQTYTNTHTHIYIYMKHYIYTNKQTKNSHALHLPISRMHHHQRLTFSTKTTSFRLNKVPRNPTYYFFSHGPTAPGGPKPPRC
jgi:hypothetical protein